MGNWLGCFERLFIPTPECFFLLFCFFEIYFNFFWRILMLGDVLLAWLWLSVLYNFFWGKIYVLFEIISSKYIEKWRSLFFLIRRNFWTLPGRKSCMLSSSFSSTITIPNFKPISVTVIEFWKRYHQSAQKSDLRWSIICPLWNSFFMSPNF
jgi:hypothetical protein